LTKKIVRVAVLVSGGGSNLQALLDAQKSGQLPGIEVVLVLSSIADAFALERARQARVATAIVERKVYATEEAAQTAVLEKLIEARADVVCLAGYMRKLRTDLVRHFHGRILNIHPALLPKFGGRGMYGSHVHEAVLAAHETE
jgi:phosphoribosylglycinamide formyltransferase-1